LFRLRTLGLRKVVLNFRFAVEPVLFDMPNDADYLAPLETGCAAPFEVRRDPLAYRILVGPVLVSQSLIDDADLQESRVSESVKKRPLKSGMRIT